MTASVLAVIPTHHRWDLLARAMDSLEDLPVLLVDDSPGGDLPRALACKSIEVVRTTGEEGFARATN